MQIVFIINPIAGSKKQKIEIIDLINKNFIDHEILYTQKSGDATIFSEEAVRKKKDIVVAVGGDGTVNECAKALNNTKIPLGIIPCGSGNGFAYYFGIKRAPNESIKQLMNAKLKKVDTGSLNNDLFVNVSGIGFDAHIANLFSKSQHRGFYTYIKLILKELSYSADKFNITYAGNSREISAFMIAFANTSQYGNNFHISPNAKTNDGLIDVVIVKKFPKWRLPLFFLKLLQGRIKESRYIEIIRTKNMTINSNRNLIHLDGEPKKIKLPIKLAANSKTLNILIPNV